MGVQLTPTRLKRGLTLALLSGLAVWPGVHFLAHRAWQIDPWHGAGWAMYGVPRAPDDPALTQRDGTLLVASVRQQRLIQRVILRGMIWRNAYEPAEDLERLLASYPQGSIDGLHLRVVTRLYDRRMARFQPAARFLDVSIAAASPPDPRVRYPITVDALAGTSWTVPSPHGAPVTISIGGDATGPQAFAVEVPQDADLTGVLATWCGDYPGCASSRLGLVALYAEADQLWFARCFAPTAPDAPLDWQSQDDLHRQNGQIIVWRSPATVCFVPAETAGAQRVARP